MLHTMDLKMNINITSIHKTGSTILQKVFRDVCYVNSKIYHDDLTSHGPNDNSLQSITVSRYPSYNLPETKHVYILRHPMGRLISQYYSYGWTHTYNSQNTTQTLEEFNMWQQGIRNQRLDDFIIFNIDKDVDDYTKILVPFIDGTSEFLVLPYELLVNKHVKFFKILGEYIDISDLHKHVRDRFADDFKPHEDRTNYIVNHGINTHRRTTNIHEYKEKLDLEYINNKLSKPSLEIVDMYETFLKKYNL